MADTSGSRSSEKRDVHLPPPKTKERRGDNESHAVFMEEDGVGVVEIILILVVLIGLVVIFKKQITNVVKSILSKISSQSEGI